MSSCPSVSCLKLGGSPGFVFLAVKSRVLVLTGTSSSNSEVGRVLLSPLSIRAVRPVPPASFQITVFVPSKCISALQARWLHLWTCESPPTAALPTAALPVPPHPIFLASPLLTSASRAPENKDSHAYCLKTGTGFLQVLTSGCAQLMGSVGLFWTQPLERRGPAFNSQPSASLPFKELQLSSSPVG